MQRGSVLCCWLGVVALALIIPESSSAEVGRWEGRTAHRITGIISFPNPTTLQIDDFSYDGGGIEVYLYYYRPGQRVDDVSGIIIPLPDGGAGGQFPRRRAYTSETLLVPLTNGLTACDIGTLTIWCEPFTATFSRVTIRRELFIDNGEGSQCELVGGNTDLPTVPPTNFDNCESFSDDSIQVSWTVDSQNEEIDFQVCGCRPLEPDANQYVAFGLSGRTDSTFMLEADATVAWVDNREGTPNAVDYYLTRRVQCRAGEGACPDTMVTRDGRQCSNDVRRGSIAGGIRNGNEQCVIFSRPLTTGDSACDTDFDPTNENQYIVWAIGGLGATAFIHFDRSSSGTPPIHLGRTPMDQCANRPLTCTSCPPFRGPRMDLLQSTTLRVHIGPSAGERGYMGITGQAGWGISWYINDTLIPDIIVKRGQTYTFIVEGGTDVDDLGRYHPFYITDSRSGGRLQNTAEEREKERVFAGFDSRDNPTGVGRLCDTQENEAARTARETCGTTSEYLQALKTNNNRSCEDGEPGVVTFTPDSSTPDIVFYQCATHLNLGWRIVMEDALINGEIPDFETASSPPSLTASLLTLTVFILLAQLLAH